MKKIINIFLAASVLMLVQSCKEEKVVDKVLKDVTHGAVLRNLGVTNGLDISNSASTWSITMESQDAQNGALLDFVRVNVAFRDNDATGRATVGFDGSAVKRSELVEVAKIQRSQFTLDATRSPVNGLPSVAYSISLQDLATGISAPGGVAGVSGRDVFVIDLEYVMTDGRTFNFDNASANITRTGRFSYFNAQFRYTATIAGTPRRVALDQVTVNKKASSTGGVRYVGVGTAARDTVFLKFSDNLVTNPTITRTFKGATPTGDVTSAVGRKTGAKTGEYFFTYTPSAAGGSRDTISFDVTAAERIAGLPMIKKSITNAFVIDAVVPTVSVGNIAVSVDADTIKSVSITLKYSEEMGAAVNNGKDTVTYRVVRTGGANFATQTIRRAYITGNTSDVLTFTPKSGNSRLHSTSALNFNIQVSEIGDIGNNVVNQTVSVSTL